jgi:glycine oxidase
LVTLRALNLKIRILLMLDYILVGQGISGTVLGLQLISKGKKIAIFDDGNTKSSSKVAAGIFNPVTGKRKVKTWDADLLFSSLNDFYPALEKELSARFYYPKPVYMLFDSIEEQNSWAGRITDVQYKKIIDINIDINVYKSYINDPFGGILAKNSGYVDVQVLLEKAAEKFRKLGVLKVDKFNYDELEHSESDVGYKGIKARKIIFCEGAGLASNPFFSWLPINLVKGELLTIELDDIPDVIFNKNIFILPLGEGRCIAGATYEWDDINTEVTESAREELKTKIDQLLRVPYQITDQRAGIRPATQDRRPYLGVHPEYGNVFVFGGLGTKGISIVPYYSGHFLEYLENQKELNKDVNISRHYSLYFSSNNSI